MKKIFYSVLLIVAIITLSISIKEYLGYIKTGNLAQVGILGYGANAKINELRIPINNPGIVNKAIKKFSCLSQNSDYLTTLNKENSLSIVLTKDVNSSTCKDIKYMQVENSDCSYQIENSSLFSKFSNNTNDIKYSIQANERGICGLISSAESINKYLQCTGYLDNTKRKVWNIEYLDYLGKLKTDGKISNGKGTTPNDRAEIYKKACSKESISCDIIYIIRDPDDEYMKQMKNKSKFINNISFIDTKGGSNSVKQILKFINDHKKPNTDCSLSYMTANGGHVANIRSTASFNNAIGFKVQNSMWQGGKQKPSDRYTNIPVSMRDDSVAISMNSGEFGDDDLMIYQSGVDKSDPKYYYEESELYNFNVMCCQPK